ncbi:protein lin-37 homolog [Aricia agestis]|uniref:protein lin-37 homolog n=1 Tax=Aricia agestis TaxID=91739 RepID=UPI001C2099C4|nr:protein lin-37 homolog [Aricia agestis]
MPLPKRKRIFTPKRKTKHMKEAMEAREKSSSVENDVTTARGRLKGALMDVLDTAEESDTSMENTPVKKEGRKVSAEEDDYTSEEDGRQNKLPPRQSYVLKLFDRSVDLSQFSEDSPLYPICRAWIANRPKANYSDFGKDSENMEEIEEGIDLPGPNGPPISKIPDLLPEQLKSQDVDKINLNYREAPLPSREQLLRSHMARWTNVRGAWLARAAQVEARYANSQIILNSLNVR